MSRSRVPEELPPEDMERLAKWLEERPDLLPADELGEVVAECLDWYRAHGRQMADWVACCRTWIRRNATERSRPKTSANVRNAVVLLQRRKNP